MTEHLHLQCNITAGPVLAHLASTADELSSGTNIDDIERP